MNIKSTSHSPTLAMHEMSSLREKDGIKVIKLGFGQSPFAPPTKIIEALKFNAHEHFYAPVDGIEKLKSTVANFHSKLDNIDCTSDNIVINAGSKILIYAILEVFNEANVIIPSPSWVSYKPQAELIGHKVIRLERRPEKSWRIDGDDLNDAVAKCDENTQKILILNYPSNPDGVAYSKEELEDIAHIARKHNILIISDEIYGRLNFTNSHISMATICPENTIVTSGLSKWCGAGGWRLGTAIIPNNLNHIKKTMVGILSETISCAPTPIQLAAITAYSMSDEIENDIKNRRIILSKLGDFCAYSLNNAGIKCTKPEGGFYSFCDFMPFKEKFKKLGITNSNALCEKLLSETGVALLSGSAFGMEDSYLSARLAFVDFDGNEALKEASKHEVDDNFIKQYCQNTYSGIKTMVNWLAEL